MLEPTTVSRLYATKNSSLLLDTAGVSKFEAKLIFAKAKMAAADEFKRRQRVISHMFIDFLEALVRLADKVNLPTLKELQEWMKSNTKEEEEEFTTPTNPFWMYCKKTTTMVSDARDACAVCCHSSSCAKGAMTSSC